MDVEYVHLNFELEDIENEQKDQWTKMTDQIFIIVTTFLTLVSVVGLFWIKNA